MSEAKNPRPRPYEIPRATVISRQACPQCGGTVQVKINKAQKAYANCYNANSDGEACGFQQRWGAVQSEAMRRAWHERKTKRADPANEPLTKPTKPNVTKRAEEPRPNGGEYDEYGL